MNNHQYTALITGAAGGIGRAVAHRFAEEGYRVVLTDQSRQDLLELAAALPGAARPLVVEGDLGDPSFPAALTGELRAQGVRADVLVNNAAWRIIESMRQVSYAHWQQTMQVCLTAPAFLMQAVAAELEQAKKPGVFVNVSSMMTDRPAGYCAAYIAAKAALEGLTRELAVTYGRSGIRVLAVKPGFIDTEISRNYRRSDDTSDQTDLLAGYLVAATPLPSPVGAQAVANAIHWLCSEQAFFITGTSLTIDGGFSVNMNSYPLKKNLFPDEF